MKLLTSNTRNPYLIWDNGTRAQLIDFLEMQRSFCIKDTYKDIEEVEQVVSQFEYDAHK